MEDREVKWLHLVATPLQRHLILTIRADMDSHTQPGMHRHYLLHHNIGSNLIRRLVTSK